METIKGITISPVNMDDRKKLGLRAGDTVRVWQKIQEKGKTRLQAFEGLVLARKHGSEPGATFTVRRVTGGVGVEKIFPLYSPMIDKIEIVRRSRVRRAKLYYIREKVAREIKRQMRNMRMMDVATVSDTAEKEASAKEEEKSEGGEVEEKVEEKSEQATEEKKDESKEEEKQPEPEGEEKESTTPPATAEAEEDKKNKSTSSHVNFSARK